MLLKIVRLVPPLTWLGLILSLCALLIGGLFSINSIFIFAALMIAVIIALQMSQYRQDLDGILTIAGYIALGYMPVLLVQYFF